MQRPGGAVSSAPKLSNGCQPFGPVSTNYSSISGERQTASGKATRGMSWIIITRPDLANITFLSADCKQQHRWLECGGRPQVITPLPPPVTLGTNTANPSTLTRDKWFIYPVRIIPALRAVSQHLSWPLWYSVSHPMMNHSPGTDRTKPGQHKAPW